MKIFNKSSEVTIDISSETIVRSVLIVLGMIILLGLIGKIRYQLELFALSAFLAMALNPAVSWLTRRLKIKSRVGATGLAYLIVVILLGAFLALVVPPLVRQTNSFVKTVPATVRSVSDNNSNLSHLIDRYHLQPQVDNLSNEIGSKIGNAPAIVISTAGRVGTVLISIITMIVLTFMMLVEGPAWMRRFLQLVPEDKRKSYHSIAMQMYKVVTGYVNGQVVIAAIASAFSFVTLMIASNLTHTSINAAALAGIVFLFGLIPLIGNTLAAILVCLICLFSSTSLALIMLFYFPIYQQIENATLQPHIQAKNNQLTPLIVFMAALVGAGLGGLLGALVAIPIAGCLRILFMYKYGDKFSPSTDSIRSS